MAEPPVLPPTPSHSPTLATPCLDQNLPHEFNIPVIVAAMLCALLCALGLNSMLQCVLRCTQRTFTEPAEWVTSRQLNSGLDKRHMVALPTSTYANSNLLHSQASSTCTICLVDFFDGDRMRVLPHCDHQFHVACIDEWLLSHSSCPMCRHQLQSRNCVPCLEIVTVL
ncbi:RING-H2 finger protein [Actinidia chinensis var. chinensis]|uniref:RING-type E3 ubiquitin transferase n=1 Tax=Actinidia chinensis var. chinensis TaxID=1590841 RepID=A0A2R6QAL7_ACTCC|nr:RING-H2 finger protein [Actinidia chinensis var. chinensis]